MHDHDDFNFMELLAYRFYSVVNCRVDLISEFHGIIS
jgi:hypothetical protein